MVLVTDPAGNARVPVAVRLLIVAVLIVAVLITGAVSVLLASVSTPFAVTYPAVAVVRFNALII
jgi:hypothetical protein